MFQFLSYFLLKVTTEIPPTYGLGEVSDQNYAKRLKDYDKPITNNQEH